MSTWIKAGFWEQLCKPCQGYKGWLNLTKFVEDLAVPGPPGPPGPQGPAGSISNLFYGSFIFDSETALTSAISNPSTTAAIQVGSTTGFFNSGYIRVGLEIIAYTGKTATTFTGITRGVATSTNSSHPIGTGVSQAQWVAANTPTQVMVDETDLSSGVTLSGTGDVTIANAGIYNIQFSIQFENFGNDYDDVVVWYKVGGVNVPKSSSYTTISTKHSGTPGATIMTINIFYNCVGGEVVTLHWQSKNGTSAITSIHSNGAVPQSPGVILTVNKVGT